MPSLFGKVSSFSTDCPQNLHGFASTADQGLNMCHSHCPATTSPPPVALLAEARSPLLQPRMSPMGLASLLSPWLGV